jgi:hypothetical protein
VSKVNGKGFESDAYLQAQVCCQVDGDRYKAMWLQQARTEVYTKLSSTPRKVEIGCEESQVKCSLLRDYSLLLFTMFYIDDVLSNHL